MVHTFRDKNLGQIIFQSNTYFLSTGVEEMLKDIHGQLIFDLRSEELADTRKFPGAARALEQAVVLIQNPGEIVFVPSGWHHQVFNLVRILNFQKNFTFDLQIYLSCYPA